MVFAFLIVVVLLIVGFVLRVTLKPLQWIFVPASIVGGTVGLLAVQATGTSDSQVVNELKSWPGFLIAVVFAGMFLDRRGKPLGSSLRTAAREGIVVWIIVLGQTALGLWCTCLLIQPFYDVPNSFGMLIETGFAGGHGTAAAMKAVYASVGLESGGDLGMFMATIGLVFSVLSGVFYVNLALRLGWVPRAERGQLITGLEDRRHPRQIALGRVRPEVLDPLVFQALILSAAFGIGWVMREGVIRATHSLSTRSEAANSSEPQLASNNSDDDRRVAQPLPAVADEAQAVREMLKSKATLVATIADFPLFIYTLFGGFIVRQLMTAFRIDDLIDTLSMQRLSAAAMEILIVSAIASLQIEAVASVVSPLMILIVAAFAWTGFCLLHVAHQLLPEEYWFELGILNYGMSTGTTATGFTLLKMIDRDLDSGAAEDYALAAPLSSPFVGGGMLTIGLPLLVLEKVPIAVSAAILTTIVIGLYIFGRSLAARVIRE